MRTFISPVSDRWRTGLLAAGVVVFASALPSQAQIKIGAGAPISGVNAPFGAQIKLGVEQAVEDINAAGGVLGQKLTASIGDDASDPKQGVAVANKFVADGVKWVVGHFNSSVSIAASDVYTDDGVLQITPASTNPRLTLLKAKMVFRTCGRDDQQGAVAAKYLLEKFRGKRIAFVHDKSTYGKGLVDETRKALKAGGVSELTTEAINVGEKDFSSTVSKLKAVGSDVVYYGGLSTEAGLLARQIRAQGMSTILMSGDGIADDSFAQIGGTGAEGALMTYPLDQRMNPAATALVRKLDAKGEFATTYALNAYAAVQVMKQAAEAAGSTAPDQMAKVMHGGKTFKTVTGDISFDANGDMTRPDYVVYRWQKDASGRITYVPPSDYAAQMTAAVRATPAPPAVVPAPATTVAVPAPPPPPVVVSPPPIIAKAPEVAPTPPPLVAVARSSQSRVALVIGNSTYVKAGRLGNPGKDAAAMADMFTRAGFQTVTLKNDLDFRGLNRALSDFEILARNKDIAVIYYAGHGIEFGGQNYLVPTDAALERDVDIPSEAVPMERALRAIDGARRFKFLILDACRDDPFKVSMERMASTRSLGDRGLARVEPPNVDMLIAYAAKAGTTASDGGGQQNSPFVAALLKQLSVPSVDVQLALRRVRDDVLAATGRRQEPYFYGSMGGDTVSIFP